MCHLHTLVAVSRKKKASPSTSVKNIFEMTQQIIPPGIIMYVILVATNLATFVLMFLLILSIRSPIVADGHPWPIVNYCVKTPEELQGACEMALQGVPVKSGSSTTSTPQTSDYKCRPKRITWTTPGREQAGSGPGVILPLILCRKETTTTIDFSQNRMGKRYDEISVYYMLGFVNMVEAFLFLSKSVRTSETTDRGKLPETSDTVEDDLRKPLLQHQHLTSSYDRKYYTHVSETDGKKKFSVNHTITSEGSDTDRTLRPHAIVKFRGTALEKVRAMFPDVLVENDDTSTSSAFMNLN